jgi:hypothetical protein
MRHVEIPISTGASFDKVERAIEQAIRRSELEVTLHGSLKKHPGCVHWHLKRRGKSGTLELTWWPKERRAWFSVQSGRQAVWIPLALRTVPRLIAVELSIK